MTIAFNHTIVAAKDKKQSATFLTELFDLPSPTPFADFLTVKAANGVDLDYADVAEGEEIPPQHYAFLVSEDEFDAIYGRIRSWGLQHWATRPQADPARSTTTTAAAACTSRTRPGITWKSSPGPTDPARTDSRR